MKFDRRFEITGSVTDPDPLSSPSTVPDARVFTLPIRAAQVESVNQRVLVGVTITGSGSSLSFELYDVDEDTLVDATGSPAAKSAWQWHLILSGSTLSNGEITQSDLTDSTNGFVGGGRYYLRVTTDYTTTTFKVKAINA
jgi:hypothetical protein